MSGKWPFCLKDRCRVVKGVGICAILRLCPQNLVWSVCFVPWDFPWQHRLIKMEKALTMGVRADRPGTYLEDYHTITGEIITADVFAAKVTMVR